MFVRVGRARGHRRRHRSRDGDRRRRGVEGHRAVARDDGRSQPGDLLAGDLRHRHRRGAARRVCRRSTCRSRRLLVALAGGARWWCCCPCCRLPRDVASPIPLTRSIAQFWAGLNSGSVLGIMLFYFLFFFQPQAGSDLHQLHGRRRCTSRRRRSASATAPGYAGYFVGVVLFVWKGVRWQERYGMRRLFRVYIIVGAAVRAWRSTRCSIPGSARSPARCRARCRFSTRARCASAFSASTTPLIARADLAVLDEHVQPGRRRDPDAAAGSLFAGFMSVTNLAYTFSYAQRRLAVRPRHVDRAAARPAAGVFGTRRWRRPTSCR